MSIRILVIARFASIGQGPTVKRLQKDINKKMGASPSAVGLDGVDTKIIFGLSKQPANVFEIENPDNVTVGQFLKLFLKLFRRFGFDVDDIRNFEVRVRSFFGFSFFNKPIPFNMKISQIPGLNNNPGADGIGIALNVFFRPIPRNIEVLIVYITDTGEVETYPFSMTVKGQVSLLKVKNAACAALKVDSKVDPKRKKIYDNKSKLNSWHGKNADDIIVKIWLNQSKAKKTLAMETNGFVYILTNKPDLGDGTSFVSFAENGGLETGSVPPSSPIFLLDPDAKKVLPPSSIITLNSNNNLIEMMSGKAMIVPGTTITLVNMTPGAVFGLLDYDDVKEISVKSKKIGNIPFKFQGIKTGGIPTANIILQIGHWTEEFYSAIEKNISLVVLFIGKKDIFDSLFDGKHILSGIKRMYFLEKNEIDISTQINEDFVKKTFSDLEKTSLKKIAPKQLIKYPELKFQTVNEQKPSVAKLLEISFKPETHGTILNEKDGALYFAPQLEQDFKKISQSGELKPYKVSKIVKSGISCIIAFKNFNNFPFGKLPANSGIPVIMIFFGSEQEFIDVNDGKHNFGPIFYVHIVDLPAEILGNSLCELLAKGEGQTQKQLHTKPPHISEHLGDETPHEDPIPPAFEPDLKQITDGDVINETLKFHLKPEKYGAIEILNEKKGVKILCSQFSSNQSFKDILGNEFQGDPKTTNCNLAIEFGIFINIFETYPKDLKTDVIFYATEENIKKTFKEIKAEYYPRIGKIFYIIPNNPKILSAYDLFDAANPIAFIEVKYSDVINTIDGKKLILFKDYRLKKEISLLCTRDEGVAFSSNVTKNDDFGYNCCGYKKIKVTKDEKQKNIIFKDEIVSNLDNFIVKERVDIFFIGTKYDFMKSLQSNLDEKIKLINKVYLLPSDIISVATLFENYNISLQKNIMDWIQKKIFVLENYVIDIDSGKIIFSRDGNIISAPQGLEVCAPQAQSEHFNVDIVDSEKISLKVSKEYTNQQIAVFNKKIEIKHLDKLFIENSKIRIYLLTKEINCDSMITGGLDNVNFKAENIIENLEKCDFKIFYVNSKIEHATVENLLNSRFKPFVLSKAKQGLLENIKKRFTDVHLGTEYKTFDGKAFSFISNDDSDITFFFDRLSIEKSFVKGNNFAFPVAMSRDMSISVISYVEGESPNLKTETKKIGFKYGNYFPIEVNPKSKVPNLIILSNLEMEHMTSLLGSVKNGKCDIVLPKNKDIKSFEDFTEKLLKEIDNKVNEIFVLPGLGLPNESLKYDYLYNIFLISMLGNDIEKKKVHKNEFEKKIGIEISDKIYNFGAIEKTSRDLMVLLKDSDQEFEAKNNSDGHKIFFKKECKNPDLVIFFEKQNITDFIDFLGKTDGQNYVFFSECIFDLYFGDRVAEHFNKKDYNIEEMLDKIKNIFITESKFNFPKQQIINNLKLSLNEKNIERINEVDLSTREGLITTNKGNVYVSVDGADIEKYYGTLWSQAENLLVCTLSNIFPIIIKPKDSTNKEFKFCGFNNLKKSDLIVIYEKIDDKVLSEVKKLEKSQKVYFFGKKEELDRVNGVESFGEVKEIYWLDSSKCKNNNVKDALSLLQQCQS